MTTSTRWIATFSENDGRFQIHSSNHPWPLHTWRDRQDLMHAIQTLILWSWEHPSQGWRVASPWERLGDTDVLMTDVSPVRIVLEDR
ncbi:hypothetical protein [Streptomyces hundungensis]|uniref:hypothetical protein n=1 Tax=Streptomyces hundungensis TaxID=1077946 RepID=UPI0031ECAE4A